jgi:hypothetical protein
MPPPGFVVLGIRRAFRALPGQTLSSRELLAWTYPRGAGKTVVRCRGPAALDYPANDENLAEFTAHSGLRLLRWPHTAPYPPRAGPNYAPWR